MSRPKLLDAVQVLERLEDGEFKKELNKELRKAAASVKAGSLKAKATLTIKLTLTKLAFDQLMITGEAEAKPSKRQPDVSVLFVLPDGELTGDNPSSLSLLDHENKES